MAIHEDQIELVFLETLDRETAIAGDLDLALQILQILHAQFRIDFVILGQQNANGLGFGGRNAGSRFLPARAVPAGPGQQIHHGIVQITRPYRLGDKARKPGLDRFLMAAGGKTDGGQQNRFHSPATGMGPDQAGNGKGIAASQRVIDNGQVIGRAVPGSGPHSRCRCCATVYRSNLCMPGGQHIAQDIAGPGAIAGQKNPQPPIQRFHRYRRIFLNPAKLQRDGTPKGGAIARGAAHADLAAHQFDYLLDDGKPKPGPAIFARRRFIGLAEGLENAPQGIVIQADAGVAHLHPHHGRFAPYRIHGGKNADRASFRELHGIADQVDQNLLGAHAVALDAPWHTRRQGHDQFQRLGLGLLRQQIGGAENGVVKIEFGGLQPQRTGLDLGNIQNIVDDPQQMFGRVLRRFHQAGLARVEFGARQQPHRAQHAIHGGANLMAHVRQELRFCLVRDGGAGSLQLRFGLGRLRGPQFLGLAHTAGHRILHDRHGAQQTRQLRASRDANLAVIMPRCDRVGDLHGVRDGRHDRAAQIEGYQQSEKKGDGDRQHKPIVRLRGQFLGANAIDQPVIAVLRDERVKPCIDLRDRAR